MTNQNSPASKTTPIALTRNASDSGALGTSLDPARRMLVTQNEALCAGLPPKEFNFCIATSSHVLGLPRKKIPAGVASTLLTLSSFLDEYHWSSPQLRVSSLRRLFIAQLGSEGVLDERAFADQLVPFALSGVHRALRAAASMQKSRVRRWALNSLADLCKSEPTMEMYSRVRRLADAINVDDHSFAALATDAASSAADAAAIMTDRTNKHGRLHRVVYSAADAAICAAVAEALSLYNTSESVDAAVNAEFDKSLADYVGKVVQILREMHAPGCQWLDYLEAPRCFCPYASPFETYDHLVLSPLATTRSAVL